MNSMVESTPPHVLSSDEIEAFTVLVLRYMDGECTAEEILAMKSAIAESAAHRALFVQVCRMQGDLFEAYVTRRTEYQQKQANAAQPSLAAAGARRTGGTSTEKPSTDLDDATVEADSSVDVAPGDQGTDTIVRELSGEDTNHHPTKTPKH
jgi:hypothetical protein